MFARVVWQTITGFGGPSIPLQRLLWIRGCWGAADGARTVLHIGSSNRGATTTHSSSPSFTIVTRVFRGGTFCLLFYTLNPWSCVLAYAHLLFSLRCSLCDSTGVSCSRPLVGAARLLLVCRARGQTCI